MKVVNYIDPGTGVTIISSLWPIFLALISAIGAFIVKLFWHPIKRIFSRNKKPVEESVPSEQVMA